MRRHRKTLTYLRCVPDMCRLSVTVSRDSAVDVAAAGGGGDDGAMLRA